MLQFEIVVLLRVMVGDDFVGPGGMVRDIDRLAANGQNRQDI